MQTKWIIKIIIALWGVSALVGCSPTDDARSLEGRWHLVAYEAVDGSWQITEPDHIARAVWIDCSDKGRRGRFEGQTVTNPIMGTYRLGSDGSFEMIEISGTLRGEPDWGNQFWGALFTTTAYIREGDELRLIYEEGSKQMVLNWVTD